MEIGIGLPATVRGVTRDDLLDWARRAEERGFSSLATIDRLVYSNFEPLVALAAAAAVTERIRLTTDIMLLPLRGNGAVVAKQTATIDALSGGRLTVGVGIGGRDDDFEAAAVPQNGLGARMDDTLDEIKRIWAGERRGFAGAIGPPVHDGGPELLVGGSVDASARRAARFGDGWTMGGGTPDGFQEMAAKVRDEWSKAGRDGEPRLVALCYFALGDRAEDAANGYLHEYYGFLGKEIADAIAGSAATDASIVIQYRDAFADAGADELVYFPCQTDPDQVDLLAEAAL